MPVFTRAKWICPREFSDLAPIDLFHKQLDKRKKELPDQLKHRHFLMRTKLCLSQKKRVKIRITADDYYKLYINGKYVCQGPAQGYYFCYYWNEVDITDFLTPGENEILADVYYQGLINRAFYSGETGLFVDCEGSTHFSLHANVIPAFYGIQKPSQNQKIRTLVAEKGLSCGVYMAYFVLKALCKMGFHKEALDLIVNESEHSWYNMVREGATTCFEAWGKDQKWNTSLCHPWASAPISVLAEDILPIFPQYGKIVYKEI